MIGSLSRRTDFARLSRNGRRVRTSSMTLVALVDPEVGHAHVAYAVPRAHGSAVRRNRTRRRLREACRALDRDGGLVPGLYLIAPRAEIDVLDSPGLLSALHSAFDQMSAS